MRKLIDSFCRTTLVGAQIALLLASCTLAWGQQKQGLTYTPSTAIDQTNSRADEIAEETVSLSAERIIKIARDEEGLLLQIKKAIVRKAYEQGRILDPDNLTDDAVFRLIREDHNVRVLATQQIVGRGYIKAKPDKTELMRTLPCRQQQQPLISESAATSKDQLDAFSTPKTQEQTYWLKHENDSDCDLFPYIPYGITQPSYAQSLTAQTTSQQQSSTSPNLQPQYQQQFPQQPSSIPQSPQQQNPFQPPLQMSPSTPLSRQLRMTQMQSQDHFGMDSDESQMAGSQADEIQGLLGTMQTSLPTSKRGMTGASWGLAGAGTSTMGMPPSLASSGASLVGSLMNRQNSEPGFGEAEARLENRSLESPSYTLPPKLPQQPRLRHHPNPYADVPSLYDLYSQYSRRSPQLDRFGEDVFRNGTGNFDELPMDLPAGPDYVVGPGDGLTINLTGGVSQRLQRVVDREGRVALPEVGAIEVSGRNMGEVQHLVQTVLREQFRGIETDVSLSRIRTVRIYVVGDVERPGAYDVSSLSTPLNALYAAGGPTSSGSLRIVRHYRGKQLIEQVDSYDLLLNGIRGDLQRLQAGDTIEVPPLSGLVTVEGMVRRPAIYELNGEKNLAEVLQLAGGVLPSGTLRHVDVERVESHQDRTMLRLDIPETNNDATVAKALEDFAVQDGDKITITPILPYADKTVYLDGHVSRPGKFAYREGMKVTDLITSYKDLLPEPSTKHAEIIRLSQPDYAPQVIAFNLGDALAGKDQNLILKPFDIVRIFGRFDFEDPPVITISGEVRDPGDHLTNGAAHLRDIIYLAGGTTSDALLSDAQVFRKTTDGKIEVINVNLANALEGDQKDNIALQPKDRVFIHRDLNKLDPPTVVVEGEVGRPGKYPLGTGMTAADLVRLAGGLKRGAYTQTADLTRYELVQGTKIESDHQSVSIGAALLSQPDADVKLRDGDVLTIQQLSGWKDVGATIKLTGEVVHPGTYGIQEGEHLSSIIQRAGGFRGDAYPYGAVFERDQIRDLEERNRLDLLDRVQSEAANIKAIPESNAQDTLAKDAAIQQFQVTLQKLQNSPPQGRIVLHISNEIERWANSTADIQVRAGDTLHIPKRPSVVLVDGAVYNPTGITFKPGKSAEWYLRQSGGPTGTANKRGTFVIRANGSVLGKEGSLFSSGLPSTPLMPGDMVVVPEKVITVSRAWANTVQTAQILSAVALAVSAARNF